ncbi:MAG: thioredoxin family protein [Bacteroidaceae bacterium]|nr:thioredoxin family protein [Bacteroidaceae bacterium]
MKKRLYTMLSVLFAAFTVASAQDFVFQFQGRTLDDGTTVAIAAEENDFGELACETNPSSNPQAGLVLKLLDTTSAMVSATLQVQYNELAPSVMQWCMGGNCVIVNGYTAKSKTFTASAIEQVQFDASNIQEEGTLEARLTVTIGSVTKSVSILFTNNAKQRWWSYYSTNGSWYINGTGKAERYYVATYVPDGYIGGEGTTIEGFSYYFLPMDVSDIQYWVSTKLPAFGEEADLETVNLPMDDVEFNSFNDIRFTRPHAIPQGGGLYVGLSFTITSLEEYYSDCPVSYWRGESICSQGFYVCTTSNTEWSLTRADLMARVFSGGEGFRNNAVSVSANDFAYTIKDTEQQMDVRIQNNGTTPVRSVRYVVETDGQFVASGTSQTYIPDFQGTSTISIPLPTDGDATVYNRTVAITEVNGNLNESEDNRADFCQYNILRNSAYMPIFEEFTGTWCGWCVRGIVAMNRAHEQYDGQAAIIAVHDGDLMATGDYQPVINRYCDGYPSGVAGRSEKTGISPNTVVNYIKKSLNNVTPAAIEANACWADAGQTAIQVDTRTTFQMNLPDGNYAIAYILTADGLTGTGSSWAQSNYYSGSSDSDPDLQYWCTLPSKVSGVVFDHVAVAAWDAMYGVSGSVSTPIKAGVSQTYSFTADISGNQIIQDKSKLKMITLLLNAETGEYINGAQTTIDAYNPTGIRSIDNGKLKMDNCYDLSGRRIGNGQLKPGIYIVNGKKVAIK